MSAQESSKSFSRTVFVSENGTAIQFYIRPCAEKAKLRSLIENRGGVLTSRIDENVFRLVLPDDCPPKQSTRNLRVQFIYDCVSQNQFLPTETYTIVPKTDAELDDQLDIENINEDNLIYCVKTRAKETKARKEYNIEDDQKLIQYIIKHRCYADVKGRKIWVEMEESFGGTRTWQSLKERYIKRIVPKLSAYNLPDDIYKKIKVGCGAWTKKDEARLVARIKANKRRFVEVIDESSNDSDSTVEFNADTSASAQCTKNNSDRTSNIEMEEVEQPTGENSAKSSDRNSGNISKVLSNETNVVPSEVTNTVLSKKVQEKNNAERPPHNLNLNDNHETISSEVTSSKTNSIASPKSSVQNHSKSSPSSKRLNPKSPVSSKTSNRNTDNTQCEAPIQVCKKLKTSVLRTSPAQERNRTDTEETPNSSTTETDVRKIIGRNTYNKKTTKGIQFSNLQKYLHNQPRPEKQNSKDLQADKPSSSSIVSEIFERSKNQGCDNIRNSLRYKPKASNASSDDLFLEQRSGNECQDLDLSQNTDCSVSLLHGCLSLQRNVSVQNEPNLFVSEGSEEEVDSDDYMDNWIMKTCENKSGSQGQSQVPPDNQQTHNADQNPEESLTALPFLDTLSTDFEDNDVNVNSAELSPELSEDEMITSMLGIRECVKDLDAEAVNGRKLVLANDGDALISRSKREKLLSYVRTQQKLYDSILLKLKVESIRKKPLSALSKQDDKVLESYLNNNQSG